MTGLVDRRSAWRWLLAAWTLMIWTSRLRNALVDDDLDGGELAVAVVIAGVFVLLGIALVATLLRRRSADAIGHRSHRIVVDLLVVAGLVRWTIRAPMILWSDEWSAGFKAVHTGLWLMTVILSVRAWIEARRWP